MSIEPNTGKREAPGWVSTPHGRFVSIVDGWQNEFHLRDHLGNTRVVVMEEDTGTLATLQQNHYYPFGMLNPSLSTSNTLGALKDNRYLYNGKELQDDFGLDWYDYGARFYDAQIGRWHSVDPLAEAYISWTPYQYVRNNPINRIDPNGMNDRPAGWTEENRQEDERLKARDLAMSGIQYIQYNSPPGTSGGGGSRRRGAAVNDELPVEGDVKNVSELHQSDISTFSQSGDKQQLNVWWGLGFGWDINILGIGGKLKINFPNANIFSYENGITTYDNGIRWFNLQAGLAFANVNLNNTYGNLNSSLHLGQMELSTHRGIRYSPITIGFHFGVIGFSFQSSRNYHNAGFEYSKARQDFYETTHSPMFWR